MQNHQVHQKKLEIGSHCEFQIAYQQKLRNLKTEKLSNKTPSIFESHNI